MENIGEQHYSEKHRSCSSSPKLRFSFEVKKIYWSTLQLQAAFLDISIKLALKSKKYQFYNCQELRSSLKL